MHKNRLHKTILAGALLTALLPGAYAQSDTPKIHVGTINADWDKVTGTPGFLHLMGHAKITSDDYDLYADDIKVYSAPGGKAGGKPGASALQEAVAEGGAMPGSQVIAHIRRPLESESYEIYSDKAVYQPLKSQKDKSQAESSQKDESQPSGQMTFTGHVKIVTKSGFLAVPSVYVTDSAVILLGAGKDYPALSTGPGHLTLTPAQ